MYVLCLNNGIDSARRNGASVVAYDIHADDVAPFLAHHMVYQPEGQAYSAKYCRSGNSAHAIVREIDFAPRNHPEKFCTCNWSGNVHRSSVWFTEYTPKELR